MSCFYWRIPLTPKATPTDPPPAHSPNIHSRLVCKDPKKLNNSSNTQFVPSHFPGEKRLLVREEFKKTTTKTANYSLLVVKCLTKN